MIDTEKLAGVLYTAYCFAVGGIAYDGKPLPTWDEFRADPKKIKQSEAWVRVAEKALEIL